jgi:hypothetical protein
MGKLVKSALLASLALSLIGCADGGYDKWAERTNKSISDTYTSALMGGPIKVDIDPAAPAGFSLNLAYRVGEGVGLPGRGSSPFYNKLSGDVTYAKSCRFLQFKVAIFNHDNALIQTEPVIIQSYDAGVKALINKDVLTDPNKSASSAVARLLVKDVQCVGGQSAVQQTPVAPAPSVAPANVTAWTKAAPLIQAALECRGSLDLDKSPLNTLAPKYVEGTWQWEASPLVPIKVFGLPISKFRFFIENSGESSGNVSYFEDATLAKIQKAAKLKPTKNAKFGLRKMGDRNLVANQNPNLTLGCYYEPETD